MNLYKANRQWANRPADERFQSLEELHNACTYHQDHAVQAVVPSEALKVDSDKDGNILLIGGEKSAQVSHFAFGQLAARAKAPASYLRTLPAPLAVECLRTGLAEQPTDENERNVSLLFNRDEDTSLVVRAATSDKYTRIWNSQLTSRLLRLVKENPNWKPPAAFPVSGQENIPRDANGKVKGGLYASQKDMFAFLVDESRPIDGSPKGLMRGFFLWNSEVGDSKLGVMTFLCDYVCGNNIVWNASNVTEIGIRHIGTADGKFHAQFDRLAVELKRYADSSASDLEAKISKARQIEFKGTKLEVLDSLMTHIGKAKIVDLTRKRVDAAMTLAEQRTERYGNPRSAWAIVGGLTENSQLEPHADQRMRVDRAAGKLLETIVF